MQEIQTQVQKICHHLSQFHVYFNAGEQEFLNKTEILLGTGDNWESHVVQQIPLPRTSLPTHTDKQLGSLEQLEVDTENDVDIRDFSERPANNMRPPKPPRKTKSYILDLIPPPGAQITWQ